MKYKDLKKRMSEAIAVREKGDLKLSRTLFEKLVNNVKDRLKVDKSPELKNLYASVRGEYIIQYRLEAADSYIKALDLGRRLYKYDKNNNIGNPLSIRSVSNTLINLGAVEQAEEYLLELIPIYNGNSASQGDTKAHLAFCLLRMGRLEEACKKIEEALKDIKLNTAGDKYVSVKLSGALNVKALILNSQGQVKDALDQARKALKIAKKDNRVFRIKQAEEIVDFLEKKLS